MPPEIINLSKRQRGPDGKLLRTDSGDFVWKFDFYDGQKADCWSLGILLYELWALKRPFNFSSVDEYFKNIPNKEYLIPDMPVPTPEWLQTLYFYLV